MQLARFGVVSEGRIERGQAPVTAACGRPQPVPSRVDFKRIAEARQVCKMGSWLGCRHGQPTLFVWLATTRLPRDFPSRPSQTLPAAARHRCARNRRSGTTSVPAVDSQAGGVDVYRIAPDGSFSPRGRAQQSMFHFPRRAPRKAGKTKRTPRARAASPLSRGRARLRTPAGSLENATMRTRPAPVAHPRRRPA